MKQDKFLSQFNLFTHTKVTHLKNQRPQRNKRIRTSTKRNDYYYGKYDLFEKQFTKVNKQKYVNYAPAKQRIAAKLSKKNEIRNKQYKK